MTDKIFNNRYRLADRIGVGGMAEVYLAYDEVLGRTVAVKVMLQQYATDPSFAQRFKQEAAAAANLQSPYIVNVYDWGQAEGVNYIVMEYVRGSDLKAAIKERGAINQRKAAEIGAQVCQALSVAHNLDIIHRDIKPQNIMIQPDGNAKVMDFGIARAKNSVMTQTSSVLGTAHYISPEQAQGKELTPASDIYSLGIVLYEAVTGRLPFDGPDAVSVAMQQVNKLPVPPHIYKPDLDPDLEDIIMKALEKRPADRFATANDMRLALNDYIGGRPVNLGSDFSQAETSVIGGLPMAGAAAVIGGGLADGTAIMPAMMKPAGQGAAGTNYRASTAGNNKRNGSSKRTIGIVVGIVVALLAIAGIVVFMLTQQPSGSPVPTVTGLSVDAATQSLQDAGFDVGNTTEDYSTDVAVGMVISQDPKAGDTAKPGTKVDLVVSKGPEQVSVPDLTNLTADAARAALDAVGLVSAAGTAEYSSTVPVNQVIRQDPAAGQTVNKGSTVTYYLSLGIENSDVPDVSGMTPQAAETTLQAAGFKLGSTTQAFNGNDSTKGLVIDQNPKAGTSTPKGSTVNITVNMGLEQVTVPDLVGKTRVDAEAAAAQAGVVLDASSSAYSSTVPQGSVISQGTPSGQSVDKGSTVSVVMSDGPEPAPVVTPTTP